MLHLARKVIGSPIRAVDGDIGTLEDFYFDDERWVVRYLVVDTGGWLGGRRVVISPMSVQPPWDKAGIPVRLTRTQVENSPAVDLAAPLTRSGEVQVLGYYGYPYYWGATNVWGTFDNPGALVMAPATELVQVSGEFADDGGPALRSIRDSTGYHLHAVDGEIGHVDDFLVDETDWRIHHLLVDTSNWIGGRSVVIPCDTVRRVDADREMLHVAATREAIERAPSFSQIEDAVNVAETGAPFTII
ncbi:MAG: PRC-barrel domain-containing protein [Vicinamibacterales bacterium]